MSILVGVDIGTTATKVVVVDDRWRVLGEARFEYPTSYPSDGAAEQDPQHWWRAATAGIRTALAASGEPASAVVAVGVSSQAPSIVVLDARSRPLRPALLWLDRRGQSECESHDAVAVQAIAGNRLDSYYAAPKLAWLLRDEPLLREHVRHVVMANGYLVQRLTGELCVDSGHTGLSLLNDLDSRTWSSELADLWGIPAQWLPSIAEPDTVVGTIHAAASSATGLVEGTPVVAGLVDGAAASVEAGIATIGDVCEMTGQSTVINAAVPQDRGRSDGSLSVMPYVVPGHHLAFGSMVSTGGILRWYREQFATGADFAELDALADTAPLGGGGLLLLPYFLGERSPIWDSRVRGVLMGLSMSTTRADMVRAILEGTAYGLAHNLDELARLGVEPTALRVVGGGAAGSTWNQIKADVTGVRVQRSANAMGAPVGAAMVAAAGVGVVDDLTAVMAARSVVTDTYAPDPDRHAEYRGYYQAYRRLYPALSEVTEDLARLRTR